MNVDDFLKGEINRRQFLGSSAKNAAGMAAGMVGLAGSVSKASPNERVSVGVIGVRSQGKLLGTALAGLPHADVTVVCDVDETLLPAASRAISDVQGRSPRGETDFRRILDDGSVDAAVIATPDHWHAPMMLMACQAGKDVYVETPVSHAIAEGSRMIQEARTSHRVIQTGLQQRSGRHFQSAVEFIRAGKLGPVKLVKAWTMHRRRSIGFKSDTQTPASVDYDMWLGPAAQRPFNPNRFHFNWHWFWDYGSGELGNWGVHMLDVARWGLDVGLPHRVSAAGGNYHFHDDQQTPDTLIVNFAYPDATIVWEHRQWSNHALEGRSAGVAFYGEAGTLVVDRSGWKVYDRKESLTANSSEQLVPHLRNFIDCVKTRTRPAADIETGHLSSALCHLGNVAYRLGREVHFDPQQMCFGPDADANALLNCDYRKPWGFFDDLTS